MKKKLFFLSLLLCLMMTGCGKDPELEKYNEDMTAFIQNISSISTQMEEIDTESDTAVNDLLACLDELQSEFLILAKMEVPKEFASIESLADEASEYMTEAVTLYHNVFQEEEYTEETAKAAKENYDRAMKRLTYISSLLQGELPEGDDIIITEEEGLNFEPVTEEN